MTDRLIRITTALAVVAVAVVAAIISYQHAYDLVRSDEFAALGVPFVRRGQRAADYAAVMRKLWAEDTASFHGEFTRFEAVQVNPKPVHTRRIPIVVGGNSDPALKRVAAFGDGWHGFNLQTDAVAERIGALAGYCREHGRDMSELSVAVALNELRRTR